MKHQVKHHLKKTEATPYPKGTRFRSKLTGTEYIIMKQCDDGELLRYEVQQIGNSRVFGTTWQHPDIERICEVELPKEHKVKELLKADEEL